MYHIALHYSSSKLGGWLDVQPQWINSLDPMVSPAIMLLYKNLLDHLETKSVFFTPQLFQIRKYILSSNEYLFFQEGKGFCQLSYIFSLSTLSSQSLEKTSCMWTRQCTEMGQALLSLFLRSLVSGEYLLNYLHHSLLSWSIRLINVFSHFYRLWPQRPESWNRRSQKRARDKHHRPHSL